MQQDPRMWLGKGVVQITRRVTGRRQAKREEGLPRRHPFERETREEWLGHGSVVRDVSISGRSSPRTEAWGIFSFCVDRDVNTF